MVVAGGLRSLSGGALLRLHEYLQNMAAGFSQSKGQKSERQKNRNKDRDRAMQKPQYHILVLLLLSFCPTDKPCYCDVIVQGSTPGNTQEAGIIRGHLGKWLPQPLLYS